MRSFILYALVLTSMLAPAVAGAQPVNLAAGKRARQSSTAYGGVADRAVDGRTDGAWGAGSVTHTQAEAGWLEIDLGAVTNIGSVVLHNRTDCCADRLIGAVLELAVDPCDRRTMLDRAAKVATAAASHTRTFTPAVPARYVCVRHTTAKHLSLAEVQVFAPPPPPEADACAVSPCTAANTVCTDRPGADTSAAGRTCGCAGGFAPGGAGACLDIDECAADTDGCLEGCENRPGTFVCVGDDAWLVAGEPGFPAIGGGAQGARFPARTSFTAVRVPSALLAAEARIRIDAGGLAVGASVARGAGATTDLPLPYTAFPWIPYQLVVETGGRRIEVAAAGPLPLRTLRFAVVPTNAVDVSPPGVPVVAGSRTAGMPGVGTYAYLLRFDGRTSIVGLAWKIIRMRPDHLIFARIWDEQGNLLAAGQGASLVEPWTGAPLTFTFEPGRTYLVGFLDHSPSVSFDRKPAVDASGVFSPWQAYTVGPATVLGYRSGRASEAEVAPTAVNVLAPQFELVLTSGACAEGTCRP